MSAGKSFRDIGIACCCAFMAVILCSCTVFRPPEREPLQESVMPADYGQDTGEMSPGDRWWEEFEDLQLNDLVGSVLSDSLDLAVAEAKLRQAKAQARKEGAALIPEVNTEASGSATKQHVSGDSDSDSTETRESYGIGLACSYEVDLWGRVRSLRRAALLESAATALDMETVAMTLAAETTLTYFELLRTRQILDLLERQLQANRQILELIELRFRRSESTALDVLQQKGVVAQTEAMIPLEKAREQALLHKLAVMLGRNPGAELGLSERRLPEAPPLPETGIPSDLLVRRPDIRAGWFRLLSADWDTGAARADRLPSLRLSASGMYEADSLSDVLDNWILNLAGSLTLPLLDGGKKRAEVDRLRAVTDERLAAYRATVLTAIQEVQDALSDEQGRTDNLDAQGKQMRFASLAREQAMKRYGSGQENYLRVLSALVTEESLRRSIVQAKYEKLACRVRLYRSLGGDWTKVLAEEKALRVERDD